MDPLKNIYVESVIQESVPSSGCVKVHGYVTGITSDTSTSGGNKLSGTDSSGNTVTFYATDFEDDCDRGVRTESEAAAAAAESASGALEDAPKYDGNRFEEVCKSVIGEEDKKLANFFKNDRYNQLPKKPVNRVPPPLPPPLPKGAPPPRKPDLGDFFKNDSNPGQGRDVSPVNVSLDDLLKANPQLSRPSSDPQDRPTPEQPLPAGDDFDHNITVQQPRPAAKEFKALTDKPQPKQKPIAADIANDNPQTVSTGEPSAPLPRAASAVSSIKPPTSTSGDVDNLPKLSTSLPPARPPSAPTSLEQPPAATSGSPKFSPVNDTAVSSQNKNIPVVRDQPIKTDTAISDPMDQTSAVQSPSLPVSTTSRDSSLATSAPKFAPKAPSSDIVLDEPPKTGTRTSDDNSLPNVPADKIDNRPDIPNISNKPETASSGDINQSSLKPTSAVGPVVPPSNISKTTDRLDKATSKSLPGNPANNLNTGNIELEKDPRDGYVPSNYHTSRARWAKAARAKWRYRPTMSFAQRKDIARDEYKKWKSLFA